MDLENREESEEATETKSEEDSSRPEEKRGKNNTLNLIITNTTFLQAERSQSTWRSVDVVDRSVDLGSRDSEEYFHIENLPVQVTSYKKLSGDEEERRINDKEVIRGVKSHCKEKKQSCSLRSVWEKRGEHIEKMEKMFENHVERVIEEKVEKHPWLHPIETWINEKCKTPSSPQTDIFAETQSRDYDSDSGLRTPKSEEGRKNPDQKIERSIIEHLKNLKAKHDKIVQLQSKANDSGKFGNPEGFKLRESNSDNRIFERKVLEQFRSVRSGGSSPIAPKRNRAEKDGGKIGTSALASSALVDDDANKNPSFLHSISRESHASSDPSDSEPLAITPPSNIEGTIEHHEEPLGNRHHHDFIDKIKEGFKEKREELHRVRYLIMLL